MAVKNLITTKYHINKARYTMLYSFDNVYSIFTPRDNSTESKVGIKSMKYNCSKVYSHTCFSVEDVLKDIFYQYKAKLLSININDIIGIKINGGTFCFQIVNKLEQFNMKNYVLIPDFLKEEHDFYMEKYHADGFVLNVIDGLLLDVSKSSKKNSKFYCIEEETFKKNDDKHLTINSIYSFYQLKQGTRTNKIEKNKEYVSIINALYQFENCRKMDSSAVLLLDRNELGMIADNKFIINHTF